MLLALGTFCPLGFTLSTQETVGGVLSTNVRVVAQELEFPDASMALHDDDADPGADRERVPGEQFALMDPLQVSVAVATTARLAEQAPPWDEVSTVTGAGQVMFGGVVSTTVTLEPQEAVLPEPSVALQETCVVPNGKLFPDAGQLVEAKPQLSDALALKVAVALLDPVHSTV